MLTNLQKMLEGFRKILRVGEKIGKKEMAGMEASNEGSVKARRDCLSDPETCMDDSANFVAGPSARNTERRSSDLDQIDGCSALKTVSRYPPIHSLIPIC